jgi:hypothetical protein
VAAVTLLGSATFSTANGTKTVTATPAVGDLIVIVTAHTGNTATTAPTDNQSGTYEQAGSSAVKVSSADTLQVWVRTATIPAATSTIFTHAPGTTSGGGLVVLKVTGFPRVGSAAVKQTAKQDNIASGTPAPVFSTAALTGNPVIGAVFNTTNATTTFTPRTGFTEMTEVAYNTPASGLEVMARDSGETGTTQTWGSSSASAFASIVVELDASAVTHTSTGALSGPGSSITSYAGRSATNSKADTLTETFNGTYPNGWTTYVDSGWATQTFTGGELVQNITDGTDYVTTYIKKGNYDLVGSSVFVRFVQPYTVAAGTGEYWCRLSIQNEGAGGVVGWTWNRNANAITAAWEGAISGGNQPYSVTYSASTHAWLRIRESGGTVYWDTAPSTASNPPSSGDWVNRASISLASLQFTPHNVSLWIYGQGLTARDQVPSAPAKWDGFNTASGAGAVSHDATGALAGPGSSLSGTAIRNAMHTSTGALTGPGSSLSGTAARTHVHDATGALTGAGSTLSGTAARAHIHTATGALTGPGSTLSGTAARTHVHDATGALAGSGASLSGTAARVGGPVTHDATGALAGGGSTLSGMAARTHVHDATGALVGAGADLTGDAVRSNGAITHNATGALVGSGSTLSGTAARTHIHDATGALAGPGSAVAGTAARTGAPVTHNATGVLVGSGSSLGGTATRPGATSYDRGPAVFGRGALGKGKVLQGMNYYQSKLAGQDAIRNIARGNSMAMAIASAVAAGEY